jgi:mTERF domain-containing protein
VFWLDLLGSTSLLMKWLSKEWLLKYSVDLLLRNLSALRDLGIPRARLAVMLRQKPSLIMQRPEKIQALIDRVDACGVPRGSGMYLWALVVLHGVRPAAFQTKKAAMMAAIGCTEQEFLAMFRRAPCFLYVSTELLLRKVEFLKDTLGCHRDYIVRNPVLLTFSLTKRMAPRCRTIEALRSRGVDIGKGSPVNAVRLSEAKFMERYILKYIEEAPELLGLYPPKS